MRPSAFRREVEEAEQIVGHRLSAMRRAYNQLVSGELVDDFHTAIREAEDTLFGVTLGGLRDAHAALRAGGRMRKASTRVRDCISKKWWGKLAFHIVRIPRDKIKLSKATLVARAQKNDAIQLSPKYLYHNAIIKLDSQSNRFVRYMVPKSATVRCARGSALKRCRLLAYTNNLSILREKKDSQGYRVSYDSISQFAKAHKRECLKTYGLLRGRHVGNENGWKSVLVRDGNQFKSIGDVARTVRKTQQYGSAKKTGKVYNTT